MVLLKGFDEHGFVFFTNYSSRKGRRARAEPARGAALPLARARAQVRVEGPVTRVTREESEAYAAGRPRQSQLSALASPQSEPVPDREWLERRVEELDREHAGGELPVREDWGGYRVDARGLGVLAAPRQPPPRPSATSGRKTAGASSGSLP
jgi:pyridoxamine 5'-phosphate oxidase